MTVAGRSRKESAPPPVARVASATHWVSAWGGVVAMVIAITVLTFWHPTHEIAYLALIVMGASALGVFLPDLLWQKVYRRSLPLSATPRAGDPLRVLTKWLGLAGSLGFVAALYWLFPEYYNGAKFYGNYWILCKLLVPALAVVSLPYIYWVDQRMEQPRDGLWQMGRLLLGQWRDVQAAMLGQHLLGWLVKGFFLPLMFTYFCDNLAQLFHYDLGLLNSFKGIWDYLYFALYFVDVALVSMTYLMSLRLTDTHIRSAEPTVYGWVVALLCYQPFWASISDHYLAYEAHAKLWGFWLTPYPWAYDLWGSLILVLVALYVWATIAFGGRFSNLTHRGIITSGPYRFSKHPAYLAKNLSWWLISTPFMITGPAHEALRRCVLLLTLNAVYFLRAKTEERHLSLDPVYVQYSRWIDEHGALRFLNRLPGVGVLARWRMRELQPLYGTPLVPEAQAPGERRPVGKEAPSSPAKPSKRSKPRRSTVATDRR